MKRCLHCDANHDTGNWACPECGRTPAILQGKPSFAPELAKKCSGFKPEYFETLALLEQKNFWFTARNQLITWAIQSYISDFDNCLEIGCGTGFVLSGIAQSFPGKNYAGCEIYSEGLSFAEKRLPIGTNLFQMDARDMPFVSEWDLIAACDVLEHIDDDEKALREMHRSLRPGGGLLLTVPQHKWMWSTQDEQACHVRRYSRAELIRKIRRVGFEILDATSFVSLLLPAMWLSRLTHQKTGTPPDPMRELKIANWLNTGLGHVMSIERRLIQWGVKMPAGGSLLVCARKPRQQSPHS